MSDIISSLRYHCNVFKFGFVGGLAATIVDPPLWGGGTACYNIKCNITKKYRQYSRQGVKCSYHTNKLHGGKNIVLHTFYTNGTRKSTTIIERREKFSRNCGNFRKKSVNDQPRSETELQPKEKNSIILGEQPFCIFYGGRSAFAAQLYRRTQSYFDSSRNAWRSIGLRN